MKQALIYGGTRELHFRPPPPPPAHENKQNLQSGHGPIKRSKALIRQRHRALEAARCVVARFCWLMSAPKAHVLKLRKKISRSPTLAIQNSRELVVNQQSK